MTGSGPALALLADDIHRVIDLRAVSSVFQLLRISEEELVLAGDAAYSAYRSRVRYRLIPLLY